MKLCKDHVTFVAFTAAWCGHCNAMKKDLIDLQTDGNSDKSHFFWFDVTDPHNEPLFAAFGIHGYPTILRFDPKQQQGKWTKYTGERTKKAILQSIDANSTTQGKWDSFHVSEPVSHSEVVKDSEESSNKKQQEENDKNHTTDDDDDDHEEDITSQEKDHDDDEQDEKLHLCAEHPTLLAFTGLGWCFHCQEAQDDITLLKDNKQETGAKFHVEQFDLMDKNDKEGNNNKHIKKHHLEQTQQQQKRSTSMNKKFQIESYPTFLVYNPENQKFFQVRSIKRLKESMSNASAMKDFFKESLKNNMQWKKVPKDLDTTDKNQNQDKADDKKSSAKEESKTNKKENNKTSSSEKENPKSEKQKNSNHDEMDMKHNHDETDDSNDEHENKSQMKGATYNMSASRDGGCLNQHSESEPDIEVCQDCITIFAFTGQWCPPCVAIKEEVEKLATNQQCGKFHFREVEHVLDEITENTLIAEGFGIESWPTFLIFNPSTLSFHQYLGPRNAQSIVNCNASALPLWPSPNLRVHFKQQQQQPAKSTFASVRDFFWGNQQQQQQMQKPYVNETTHNNSLKGRVKMCAHCPTVVYFALSETTFPHAEEQDHNANGIHALHFCNAKDHDSAFNLFWIRSFPKILVYCPDMNLFYEYSDLHRSDLQSIKKAYHKRGGLTKVWPTHPRVELINN